MGVGRGGEGDAAPYIYIYIYIYIRERIEFRLRAAWLVARAQERATNSAGRNSLVPAQKKNC